MRDSGRADDPAASYGKRLGKLYIVVILVKPRKALVLQVAHHCRPGHRKLTVYDEEHMITNMRMLDTDQQGAAWRDVSRIVLRIDPDTEVDRARIAFESHLSRARWMTEQGYRHLLRSGA